MLKFSTYLEYFVTSSAGIKSAVFRFKTFPIYDGDNGADDFKKTFAIYGDLGVQNDVSLPQLIQCASDGDFDMVGG